MGRGAGGEGGIERGERARARARERERERERERTSSPADKSAAVILTPSGLAVHEATTSCKAITASLAAGIATRMGPTTCSQPRKGPMSAIQQSTSVAPSRHAQGGSRWTQLASEAEIACLYRNVQRMHGYALSTAIEIHASFEAHRGQ